MIANDDSTGLLKRVQQSVKTGTPLSITGGDTKSLLGEACADGAETLSMLNHSGIISYDPTELVVSVRSGTRLSDLNKALADAGQMLPFEPPELSGSTIGGVLACGLSGPRRPFSGAARDYVLGTRVINGHAQDLSFGGEVMKNVAGYDVSRLQIGAWGTLGVLLDVSMKVLPVPELELTLRQQCDADDLQAFAPMMRLPLPLSGAMLVNDERYLRLSGSTAAVQAAAKQLGGDVLENNSVWQAVRDHTHPFFDKTAHADDLTLWRISVPDFMPALDLSGNWLFEWGGGQRWLQTPEPAERVFSVVQQAQGHAMRYGPGSSNDQPAFQPLSGPMQRLQTRVRDSFDPLRLFNRGRFHPELDTLASADAADA